MTERIRKFITTHDDEIVIGALATIICVTSGIIVYKTFDGMTVTHVKVGTGENEGLVYVGLKNGLWSAWQKAPTE